MAFLAGLLGLHKLMPIGGGDSFAASPSMEGIQAAKTAWSRTVGDAAPIRITTCHYQACIEGFPIDLRPTIGPSRP